MGESFRWLFDHWNGFLINNDHLLIIIRHHYNIYWSTSYITLKKENIYGIQLLKFAEQQKKVQKSFISQLL